VKRILLDVDGVLADFATMAVNYARSRGVDATHANLSQWDLFKAMGCEHLQDDFDAFVNACSAGASLTPYAGSRAFYTALCQLGEVVIVTSPYKKAATWCYDRRLWLRKWFNTEFGEPEIVFTSAKYLVRGDVLIDDGPHNVNEFPGPVVIIDRPWNQPKTINTLDGNGANHARVRCDNYGDAVEAVDFLLKQGPREVFPTLQQHSRHSGRNALG
jgi:5'-nucleotidase